MDLSDSVLDHLRLVAALPDLTGTRYELECEIGRGGMGVVYRARDGPLGRRVALKVLDSALAGEAPLIARLEHPAAASPSLGERLRVVTRPVIGSILAGSTIKGMLVGLFCGWFARKVQSTKWGIVVGAALGLLFAFGVAAMDTTGGQKHYLEIMLPGFITGAIIGFATQRAGTPGRAA